MGNNQCIINDNIVEEKTGFSQLMMATPQIVCKKLVEGFALSERSNPGDIVVMRKVIKYWQPDNESEEFEVSLRELSRKL